MKEMTGHSGAVNTLEFHPSECLLASGSADKTIRFWDVEKFELVSASEPDAGNVKCILFYPETEGEMVFLFFVVSGIFLVKDSMRGFVHPSVRW